MYFSILNFSSRKLFTLGQVRPNDQFQFDSIELEFPKEAIPGSVGAVVYLTGERFNYCNELSFWLLAIP